MKKQRDRAQAEMNEKTKRRTKLIAEIQELQDKANRDKDGDAKVGTLSMARKSFKRLFYMQLVSDGR